MAVPLGVGLPLSLTGGWLCGGAGVCVGGGGERRGAGLGLTRELGPAKEVLPEHGVQ